MSWREGRSVGRAEFEPFGRRLSAIQPLQPDGMDNPVARAAIARDRSLRQFLGWSILPIAQVERGRCKAKVTIGDGRYVELLSHRSRLARETIVPLSGSGC